MFEQKKIAIVVGTFPVVSQTFIVNQINALIDKGFNVTVFSYKKGQDRVVHKAVHTHNLLEKVIYFKRPPALFLMRLFQIISWVILHWNRMDWQLFFKAFNVFKFGKLAWSFRLFYACEWFLFKDRHFDIIHAHFGHNAKVVLNLKTWGFISKQTKVMTTFHGYDLMPNKFVFYKKAYASILKESDSFTVNSLYLKSQLQELKPDLKHIHILPVGLDTQFFKPTEITEEKNHFDIVFCGRLIPLKGLELAIDIIKALIDKQHQHVRFFIIGEGPLYQVIQDKITRLQLENHIILKGALSQHAIKNIFEQSDLFLLPGIEDPETGQQEAQGLVIQEAQAMTLPVIVSDVGGMKHGILPSETGIVVAENDLNGFVAAIESLINNPTLRKAMGKKAREFVVNHYDNRILCSKLIEIYSEVLKN